ncbi:MAG TPA: FixH family protein [Pyrinomonadaceae bacterium]|nr:FixH family protein [Pyrinomonadaceae bacterium]
MFSKRHVLIALCVGLAIVQGCRQRNETAPDLTLTHEVSPQPPRTGQVTITLRLTDTSGTAVTGARIKLEGNMSHAGMAPVFADANEIEPGRYQSSMELTMAGDWHVSVRVTLPDGRQFERQFEIDGVG